MYQDVDVDMCMDMCKDICSEFADCLYITVSIVHRRGHTQFIGSTVMYTDFTLTVH